MEARHLHTDITIDNADGNLPRWYVLRDLHRAQSKNPGYEHLAALGFEVFTPMVWKIVTRRGQRIRVHRPVISDLLFVRAAYVDIAATLVRIPALQFRYLHGGYCKPMIVSDREMNHFIQACRDNDSVRYLLPNEIDNLSIGQTVRIAGGAMEGVEGRIVKIRGARKRRVIVEIPGFVAALVEIEDEFLQLKENED